MSPCNKKNFVYPRHISFNRPEEIYKVITVVILVGSGIALLGILEYIFIQAGRIVSTFTNPNPFGTYLLMLFLFTWGLFLRARKLSLKLSSYIFLIALFLTGSRGSYLLDVKERIYLKRY